MRLAIQTFKTFIIEIILHPLIRSHTDNKKQISKRKSINQKNRIQPQTLENIQQSTQEPKDIGKVNIISTMLWMKNNAYEPTTIKRVAKELRHLEWNCNISSPEEVNFHSTFPLSDLED